MKIRLTIMYDGAPYCGWQIQPGQKSVQGEITYAIFKLTGERAEVTGSGRTDAGVHALGQVASFELQKSFDIKKIPGGLNYYLEPSIRVIDARRAKKDFNARNSAKRKTYVYEIYIAEHDNPFLTNRALRVCKTDIPLMKEAAKLFIGTHDFKCFMSSNSSIKTTVRTVFDSKLTARGDKIAYAITADGFLYNMVRKIVGAILAVGTGKRDINSINSSLNEPFIPVQENAPACGLYLKSVKY